MSLDNLFLQILNGLDKGGAYALIALGLTLTFGTLGVVNFAHGALFMLGAFCAVAVQALLTVSQRVRDESITFFEAYREIPYLEVWFGETGSAIIDLAVPISLLVTVPVMLGIGLAMERGLIRFFYRRPHADQILVTFGAAIVLQEIVKAIFGANPVSVLAPEALSGGLDISAATGVGDGLFYPWWRLVYLLFSLVVIGGVFAFLHWTTYGMVIRAGMQDSEMTEFLGIDIHRRFTAVFGLAAVVAGVAGVMYTPILPPDYHVGMDYLVLSFVVVVVGGMGSLGGAVAAGFLLGILQSLASMNEVKAVLPAIDHVIIYAVTIAVLLFRPRGLWGRKGVMT